MTGGTVGQLMRFAVIGVASTAMHLGLYLVLRPALGPITANVVALLLTAVANTEANRRLTFGIRDRSGAARQQLQGLIVLGLGLALTSGALAAVGAWVPDAGRLVEIVALILANGIATVVRFVAFRSWVFRPEPAPRPSAQPIPA